MNGRIFQDWVKNKLTPALPPQSVVVMDNASYHSQQVEGSKPPTSATKKQDMVNWLKERHVAVDPTLKKPQVYEIVKTHKERTDLSYTVDSHLQQHGHQVLRLPPYHCELNPIELIWGDLKQFVASENSTFKQSDVKQLIERGIERIDQQRWEKACMHVQKIEEDWCRRDNIQQQTVEPVIVQLDATDESDDSEDNN